MVQSAAAVALEELRNPSSSNAHIAALKHLKNDLIGHDHRKAAATRQGIIPMLVGILQDTAVSGGKRRSHELNGHTGQPSGDVAWNEEEEVRLHSILLLGNLARGGPAFIAPIIASGPLWPLLTCLRPSDNPPKIIVAALRTLITVVESLPLIADFPYHAERHLATQQLPEVLNSREALNIFSELLSLPGHPLEVSLVVRLLYKACPHACRPTVLVKSGILDLLCSRLAALIIYLGYILPGVDAPTVASLPSPPSKSELAPYLSAIRIIVHGSKYRTARFLYSPAVVAVFPTYRPQPPHQGLGMPPTGQPVQPVPSPMERLLPHVPNSRNKIDHLNARAFPHVNVGFSDTPRDVSRASPERLFTSDDLESPMFAWLLHIGRSEEGWTRITAFWLLKSVSSILGANYLDPRIQISGNGNRDRILAFLTVPLLVKLIDQSEYRFRCRTPLEEEARFPTLEQAPLALAALIDESKILQQAAYEAGAVQKLASILKGSFATLEPRKHTWTADQPGSENSQGSKPLTALGDAGLSALKIHKENLREAALGALGAIAGLSDEHRKAVVKCGVVPSLIDSLKPYSVAESESEGLAGSPTRVNLAACYLARSLARSIAVLRTSLVDAGIAEPIYELVKHPNLEVKLAATDVVINMSANGSPLQDKTSGASGTDISTSSNSEMERLIESGVLEAIQEHARSANPTLRYLSLWALKHIILHAPYDSKVQCLEGVGSGLLVQILTGEDQISAHHMGAPNAAGEQVDLLNAPEPSIDIEDSSDEEQEDEDTMVDSMGMLSRPSNIRSTSNNLHKSRLKAIKNAEQNPILQARREDLLIQEQALDFLRNLMNGPPCAEIIDYVFQNIGSARIFDILTSKLRPRSSFTNTNNTAPTANSKRFGHQFLPAHRSPTPNSNLTVYQPPEIIESTVKVLVHLAAGAPKHRALLVAQKSLLSALTPHFSHSYPVIRKDCLQVVSNLIWADDSHDQLPARQRASELRYMGVDERARVLAEDGSQDVKERAKIVVEQLKTLLDTTVPLSAQMGGRGFGRD
ncbi:MAG: hypothetical protein M1820_007717 [Bogoriella megaspora]|nr:MAG: hypothetical protein M1820_007717 [Bogoriella megaspora]